MTDPDIQAIALEQVRYWQAEGVLPGRALAALGVVVRGRWPSWPEVCQRCHDVAMISAALTNINERKTLHHS